MVARLRVFIPLLFAVLFLTTTPLFGQVEGISDPTISDKPLSILNNWNFDKPIANDPSKAPNDWWLWEAALAGVGTGRLDGFNVRDNTIVIRVSNPGSEFWHVQLNQLVRLLPGQTYLVSFRARADVRKAINVRVVQQKEPRTVYFIENIELTEDWQKFSFYYTHPEKADENVLFGFELGKTVATSVYISEVILRPVEKVESSSE